MHVCIIAEYSMVMCTIVPYQHSPGNCEDFYGMRSVETHELLGGALDDLDERDITVFIIFICFNCSFKTRQLMRYKSIMVGKKEFAM